MTVTEFDLINIAPEQLQTINTRRKFSLLVVSGNEIDSFNQIQQFSLNNRQMAVINQIIAMCSNASVGTVLLNPGLTEQLCELTGTPQATIRRFYRQFVEFGILKEVSILLNEQHIDVGTGYRVATPNELTTSILSNKANTHSRGQTAVDTINSTEQALQEKNLNFSQIDITHHLPAGFAYDTTIFPLQLFALAPKRRSNKNYIEQKFSRPISKNSSARYVVAAKAHRQVVTELALSVAMASINIAIAYNAKMMKTGAYNIPFQEKSVPIQISDTIRLMGLADGGRTRKQIRNCYTELRETIYNWITIDPEVTKGFSEEEQQLFREVDFQFIVGLESNTNIAPTIKNGRTTSNPLLYFVQFHDTIIEKLSNRDYFLSVPQKIATDDPLIFTFYMTLRNLRAIQDSYLVSDIAQKMFYQGSTKLLISALIESLSANYCINDIQYTYNLCGYYLVFKKNPDGEDILNVLCDNQEMIEATGARYNQALGNNNAPTIANPLKAITVQRLKAEDLLEQVQMMIYSDMVTTTTKRYVHYKKLSVRGHEFNLTAYTEHTELEKIAHFISVVCNVSNETVIEALLRLQAGLKRLGYGEMIITRDHISEVLDLLSKSANVHLSIVELIELSKQYRERMIRDWFSGNYQIVAADIIKKLEAASEQ